MSGEPGGPGEAEVEALYLRLKQEAEASGYNLNPDEEFSRGLAHGLLVNAERYGYASCPCRLASGKKEDDLDIVCPCDYRDADLSEFGACYCALYVSSAIARGEAEAQPVPERRPPKRAREKKVGGVNVVAGDSSEGGMKVWRCKVCGYLCARDAPPDVCPICKAGKERFEQLTLRVFPVLE